jgi:hypothetical protein
MAWYKLPTELKEDVNFAQSVTLSNGPIVYEVFKAFPLLQQEQELWLDVMSSSSSSSIYYLMQKYVPHNI